MSQSRRQQPADDPSQSPLRLSGFRWSSWDERIPVPPELHLTCEGCGEDLTWLEKRTCPQCGRPFHLPIPPDLDLHCLKCNYELTGLTARRCPECGTPFSVRELLRRPPAYERYPLADRFPWFGLLEWCLAIVSGGAGLSLAMSRSPLTFWIFPASGTIVAIVGFSREMSMARIAFCVGMVWLIIGAMCAVIWL